MPSRFGFNWVTEFIGGVAVFLAMSYVMLANPRILGQIGDTTHNGVTYAGPELGTVFVSTCFLSGILSILIGWRAWSPAAIACGMGLNGLMVAFAGEGFNWRWLLVINFIVGVIVWYLSQPGADGSPSVRDRMLRDPQVLPRSLSAVVEASVAGMFLGIAITLIAADHARITGQAATAGIAPALWSNERGIMPAGVAVAALIALVFVSALTDTWARLIDQFVSTRGLGSISGAPFRALAALLRLAGAVKIVAVAIGVAFLFNDFYNWNSLPRQEISDMRFPGLLEWVPYGPLNWSKPMFDALAQAFIYAGTVAFVLLFDVSGSPHQVLPQTAPEAVARYASDEQWTEDREERVRRGFSWEAFGNLFAPFFLVSPVTCYGENNVARDVGTAGDPSARTGIPSILVGLLFLAALGFAFVQPAAVQYWIAAVPGTAVAVMLAWISLIIGRSLSQSGSPQAESESPEDEAEARLYRWELMLAGIASVAASWYQGLALGLCVGILLVCALRLLFGRFQAGLVAIAFLAGAALIGQGIMIFR